MAAARFDHLVVAVEDLDAAAARWTDAGLTAVRGGAHPVGTENALVRGPRRAYVELIAAGSDESNPWLDRVRSARGPISWALAVDDVDAARASLTEAGFTPSLVVDGSRRTPDGDLVEWRLCDVGDGPYDGALPFLIQWTTPMDPGPTNGPVIEHVSLTPADPDRLADLLLAVGFVPSRHWPRRMFRESAGILSITLGPPGEPVEADTASWTMSWEQPDEPRVSIAVRLPQDEPTRHTLDGVAVTAVPDSRRFRGAFLLPSLGDPDAVRVGDRADAWVAAIGAAGLGAVEPVDPASLQWAEGSNVVTSRAVRVRGAAGTLPLTVGWGSHPSVDGTVVVVGVGDPVEIVEQQPQVGWSDPAYEVGMIDDAFVLVLSGGVHVVREGRFVVTRSIDGVRSSGLFADGEAQRWLAEAADGRRTDGVVAGDPWL